MELTCRRCGLTKPENEFHRHKTLKTGRYPHCKTCGVAVNRERRQAKSAAESALGPVLGPTRKNVPRPGAGRPGRRNASDRLHANREWLTAEYQVKGRTATSLAEEAACAVSTITGYLHAYGITVRSSAELLRARRGELRPGTGIKGPAHYNWRGGKHSPCPDCGKPKAKRSKRCQTCAGVARRGVNALSWSGPDVGYAGAHCRVRAERGSASNFQCTHCESPAQDWAYDHQDLYEKYSDKRGLFSPYSTKVEHYFPLCKKCHSDFDQEQVRQMVREGDRVVYSPDPPSTVLFSFHWLATVARNNRALWVGVDGLVTTKEGATYQAIGISPDFKGLICRRVDVASRRPRRVAA
jgi:hypothetical protein